MDLAKLGRKQLAIAGLGLGLLVTPYLACSSSESETPAQNAREQQEKLLGNWQGTAEIDGETIPFSLSLEARPQRSTPERLVVAGTLTSENPSFDGSVDGYFGVEASSQRATLSLRLDNGKTLLGTLEGEALSDGRIESVADTGAFGLTRP